MEGNDDGVVSVDFYIVPCLFRRWMNVSTSIVTVDVFVAIVLPIK